MPNRVWAIADTHLSFAKPKDMARFGEKWVNHEARLADAWKTHIASDDVVLIPGDISWAQSVARIWADLAWLCDLPGHKVLLRGNHDHWWKDIRNVRKIVEPMGFYALEGDSISLNGTLICGAMGHIAPHDPYYKHDTKKDRYARELKRLENALTHAVEQRSPGQPLVLMMHYPPFTSDGRSTAYTDLISAYQPTVCVYGHLHQQTEWEIARSGLHEGVYYALVAADYLGMMPRLVWPLEKDEG